VSPLAQKSRVIISIYIIFEDILTILNEKVGKEKAKNKIRNFWQTKINKISDKRKSNEEISNFWGEIIKKYNLDQKSQEAEVVNTLKEMFLVNYNNNKIKDFLDKTKGSRARLYTYFKTDKTVVQILREEDPLAIALRFGKYIN